MLSFEFNWTAWESRAIVCGPKSHAKTNKTLLSSENRNCATFKTKIRWILFCVDSCISSRRCIDSWLRFLFSCFAKSIFWQMTQFKPELEWIESTTSSTSARSRKMGILRETLMFLINFMLANSSQFVVGRALIISKAFCRMEWIGSWSFLSRQGWSQRSWMALFSLQLEFAAK